MAVNQSSSFLEIVHHLVVRVIKNHGWGTSDFYLNSFFFFILLFRVENIAFSSGKSGLISSLQVFFPFSVPIPEKCQSLRIRSHGKEWI